VFLVTAPDDTPVMEALLAGGADALDLRAVDGGIEILAEPRDYDAILKALQVAKLAVVRSELTRLSETNVDLKDPSVLEQVQDLLDDLDDHPDVQEVYHNAVLPVSPDPDA